MFEIALDYVKVWYQTVHYVAPSLVERLVPDAGSVCANRSLEALTSCSDRVRLSFKYSISMLDLDQIHFVHQSEHMGPWRILLQGFNYGRVCDEVSVILTFPPVELQRLYIEDIYKDANIREDVLFLRGEVVLGKSILSVSSRISHGSSYRTERMKGYSPATVP